MSLKSYPKYKDSGIEWIGQIPAHWNLRPFFSIARQNRRSNKGLKEQNLKSLSYGRIVSRDITTQDGLLPESFETYQIIERNDVVFRLTDLQNDKRSLRTAIVGERGIITSAYLSVRPTDIEPNFLAYAMRDADLRKVFYSMGGGLRQSIKYEDIKRLPVVFPPRSEQREIVEYLNRETAEIDAFIADQERLIELLEERRTATVAHAVTKGLDPNAPMKDSGINWLGNVPDDWSISPLKWISQLVTGTTPSTTVEGHYTDDVDGFPWIRPGDINESGQPTVASQKLSSTGRQLVRTLPPKAVLLVCIGTVGKVGITDDTASTNQQITAIYGKGIESKYLFYTMQVAYPEVRLAATGTTLPILNSSRLGSLRIPLPSKKEQQDISAYLERETSAIDAAISDAREAIALSQERRAALISAAVTGQIDVSQAQSRSSAGEMLKEEVRV